MFWHQLTKFVPRNVLWTLKNGWVVRIYNILVDSSLNWTRLQNINFNSCNVKIDGGMVNLLGSVAQVARGEVQCFKFSRDTNRTLTGSEPTAVGATANVLEDLISERMSYMKRALRIWEAWTIFMNWFKQYKTKQNKTHTHTHSF